MHAEKHTIHQIVKRSRTKEEARDMFENLHGLYVPRHVAELMFRDASGKKYDKSYTEKVESHYKGGGHAEGEG